MSVPEGISPLPWFYENFPSNIYSSSDGFDFVAEVGSDEDGAFIVRAVNSHTHLVAALESARAWMNNGPELRREVMDKINAALAAAKGTA